MKTIKGYAIQCSKCLRYLGISEEKQQQVILCPDCVKQNSPKSPYEKGKEAIKRLRSRN